MTAPAPMTANAPIVVKHVSCPEWGLGYLAEERDEKRFYDFEDGHSHSIAKAFWSKLEPVSLGTAEIAALEKKVRSLRDQRSTTTKSKTRVVAVPLANFDAQYARFMEIFPGGFAGDRFVKDERGVVTVDAEKKSKAGKAQAIAMAQSLFAKAELDRLIGASAFAEVLANVRAVHKAAAGLLHPLGDIIPFNKMPAERDRAFAEALRELLHGDGAYDARFDRFVATLAEAQLATWPLATVLSSLVFPNEHAFVKPSYYEKQAALLGFDLRYERVPNAAAYGRMKQLAEELAKRLTALGQTPRDNLDVYAFIGRTLGPQKK
ncbi:MAG: hypothetical protein IPM54_24080 [Polyangiaceae bacterium]|nr:hypothetical protein [Polyangiaceae bacterium]